MIKNTVEQVKEVKKITDTTVRIPVTYLFFVTGCLLLMNPKFLSYINMSNWIPEDLEKLILGLFNVIYNNIITIYGTLFSMKLLLLLLSEYTPLFNKILPEEVVYMDDTSLSWNEYSAIRRITAMIIWLSTQLWVYYFIVNLLFNPYNFVDNFIIKGDYYRENNLISHNYLTGNNLIIMNILFYINVVYTVFLVLKSLFEIRAPLIKPVLTSKEFKYYIQINSFMEKRSNGEKFETIILKKKFRKKEKFLLVNVQLSIRKYKTIRNTEDHRWIVDDIQYSKRTYAIIDSADNLSDIVYHFEVLKIKGK